MTRRTLLAVAAGASTLAGCSGSSATDAPDTGADDEASDVTADEATSYEPCDRMILHYADVPSDVKSEVDAALETGRYETDGQLLWEQIAGEDVQAIEKAGTYYRPIVDTEDGTRVLRFEETTPEHSRPIELKIENATREDRTLSITIEDSDGSVVEDTVLTVDSHGGEDSVPISRKFGCYTFDIAIEDFWEGRKNWEIDSSRNPPRLWMYADEDGGSRTVQLDHAWVEEKRNPCPWAN